MEVILSRCIKSLGTGVLNMLARFIFAGCLFNRWSNKCGLGKITVLVWKKEDRVQYR